MKRLLIWIVCLCMLASACAPAFADASPLSLSASLWFGKTIEDAEAYLLDQGYQAEDGTKEGLFANVAWKYLSSDRQPNAVTVWFDEDTRQVDWIAFTYGADPDLFEQIRQTLNMICGEPVYQEQWEDQQARVTVTYPENDLWTVDSVRYSLAPAALESGDVGTFQAVKDGKTGFSIRITQAPPEASASAGEAAAEPSPAATSEPSATPKPTATPEPVKVDVAVHSVAIKETNYGTREFYIRFKNNGSVNVDRIDFQVQGYNRYGERIESYGINTVEFYYDEILKPGNVTPQNYYYTYYMLNEATSIRLAVVKYHTSDGRTVEIPESQQKWEKFDK